METLASLIHMGGYAGYVWPAYGLSVVVLAFVLVASLSDARSAETRLESLRKTRRERQAAGDGTENAA